MEVTTRGAIALRQFRQQLQEEAGSNFPQDVLIELLVLHDVCKNLDMNIFQAREVLGESGWTYVASYINSPACDTINWKRVNDLNLDC